MQERLARLDARIEELAERLRRVEEKLLSTDEHAPRAASQSSPRKDQKPTDHIPATEGIPATAVVAFVGRTLLVMGGAFLLRWLTQSGTLPQAAVSVIGMMYALLWIAMADVTGGRGQRYSAAFHGVTGALIALPLLVEATTKFHYLSPTASAIGLLAFVVIGLVVAGRRKLRVLAWIVALPAAPLAFLLAVMTGVLLPFLLSLLALGVVTLWLGYLRGWHFLATLMSGAANVGLLLMVLERVKGAEGAQEMTLAAALFLLFGLIAIYFGSYCFRVFRRKRTITPLEIGNTLVVLLVGLGGAAAVVNADEQTMLPLSIVCLVLSTACYTAAFGFLPRLDPNRTNFLFFTLLGFAMALLGFELTFERTTTAMAVAVVALFCGVVARFITSPVLFLHGAAYLLMAIVGSGLAATAVGGLVGASTGLAAWGSVTIMLPLIVTIAYVWLPCPSGRARDAFLGRRAVSFFLLVSILSAGAIITALVVAALPVDGDENRGAVAAIRTGVLALSAVMAAWAHRRTRLGNLIWLVYTILAIGAIKFALEDVPAGGASTLFISLGLYGGALIVSPRLLRRSSKG